jgi:ribosomal protein L40E
MGQGLRCACHGAGEGCPLCNPQLAAELEAELAIADARYREPPCLECGAKTPEEAETLCRCGGDKDHCHGCDLWPD